MPTKQRQQEFSRIAEHIVVIAMMNVSNPRAPRAPLIPRVRLKGVRKSTPWIEVLPVKLKLHEAKRLTLSRPFVAFRSLFAMARSIRIAL